jgi:hypothetical protein
MNWPNCRAAGAWSTAHGSQIPHLEAERHLLSFVLEPE